MKVWILTVLLLSATLFALVQWALIRDREQFARDIATHSPALVVSPDIVLSPPQRSTPTAPPPAPPPTPEILPPLETPPPQPAPRATPRHAADPQTPDFATLGRTALAFVGSDPSANDAWYQVINDLSLDSHTRKDLIEDLNQDGFDDPRHLTPQDLPLIESRIALIEQVAPFAPDDTNYAAFQEAYKDLLNMRKKAAQNAQ